MEDLLGFFGWSAQGKNILNDTEGFFGWSAGKAINAIFNVIPPPFSGTEIKGLIFDITWNGGGFTGLDYSNDFGLERQLPTNTLITVSTYGGNYLTTSQGFTIAPNQIVTIPIRLAFLVAYGEYTRRYFA